MKESDMYKPVKDFFTGLGYAVNAEVMGIDICMRKDGVLTVVELKKNMNFKLLCQAVDRQSVTSQVFVAVPRPKYPHGKENDLARRIVKRLGLGLIYVKMDGAKGIEIVHFPPADIKSPSKLRKARVDKELAGRSADMNVGGQSGAKVVTAYRERAMGIAQILARHGPMSAKELRQNHGCGEDTSNILYRNHYGWFKRIGRGQYALSAAGETSLL